MTSPKREGRPVKQPSTSSSHAPKGGRAGKTNMKRARQGKAPSKYGQASMSSSKGGGARAIHTRNY